MAVPETLLILGLPRSGTTLLATMLDQHPDICAPPETWALLALEQLGNVNIVHPADCQLVGNAFKGTVPEAARRRAIAAAMAVLRADFLAREGGRVYVDKTPRNYMIQDFIRDVFPEARSLFLLRDPFDVAASYLSTWEADVAALAAAGADSPFLFDFILGLDLIEGRLAAPAPVDIHLRYEALVADPRPLLTDLLLRLELPADAGTLDAMVAFGGRVRRSVFGDKKIHQTAQPHAASVGRWRSILSPTQVAGVLALVGQRRLEALGYGESARIAAALAVGVDPGVAPDAAERVRGQYARRLQALEVCTRLDKPLNPELAPRFSGWLTGG